MNIIKHAEIELKSIGYDLNDKEEGPNKWIVENLFELLTVFSKQGHSGSSAPYCINMFSKLANFEPLSPLRGTDDEWVEVSDNLWQNIRCGHVFKNNKGEVWDINGRVFIESNGCSYTCKKSVVYIDFPYTPQKEYVNVDEEGNEIGGK